MSDEKEISSHITQDITRRMEGFEEVRKKKDNNEKRKTGSLPYGHKRYKNCKNCGEVMEISSMDNEIAIYICRNCGETLKVANN